MGIGTQVQKGSPCNSIGMTMLELSIFLYQSLVSNQLKSLGRPIQNQPNPTNTLCPWPTSTKGKVVSMSEPDPPGGGAAPPIDREHWMSSTKDTASRPGFLEPAPHAQVPQYPPSFAQQSPSELYDNEQLEQAKRLSESVYDLYSKYPELAIFKSPQKLKAVGIPNVGNSCYM